MAACPSGSGSSPIAGFLGIVAFDLLVMARRREHVTTRTAVAGLLGYVALAVVFGRGPGLWGPARSGPEFAAGYLTEYSLSVDNLFVFLVVMTRMQVPASPRTGCCSSASCSRWSCGRCSSSAM